MKTWHRSRDTVDLISVLTEFNGTDSISMPRFYKDAIDFSTTDHTRLACL